MVSGSPFIYGEMSYVSTINGAFLVFQWWTKSGDLLQQFKFKGRDVKDLRCSPDFSTFVTVDDVGIIYILKQITKNL